MKMTQEEVLQALSSARRATPEAMGDMVHIWYKSFGKSNEKSKAEAERASSLGLPPDHYTGRLVKTWLDSKGDLLISMHVELERPDGYRTFNVVKGDVLQVVVLGKAPVASA
jgi:hypothetical protein